MHPYVLEALVAEAERVKDSDPERFDQLQLALPKKEAAPAVKEYTPEGLAQSLRARIKAREKAELAKAKLYEQKLAEARAMRREILADMVEQEDLHRQLRVAVAALAAPPPPAAATASFIVDSEGLGEEVVAKAKAANAGFAQAVAAMQEATRVSNEALEQAVAARKALTDGAAADGSAGGERRPREGEDAGAGVPDSQPEQAAKKAKTDAGEKEDKRCSTEILLEKLRCEAALSSSVPVGADNPGQADNDVLDSQMHS